MDSVNSTESVPVPAPGPDLIPNPTPGATAGPIPIITVTDPVPIPISLEPDDDNTIEIDDDWSLVLGDSPDESEVPRDVESIDLDEFEGEDEDLPLEPPQSNNLKDQQQQESESVEVSIEAEVQLGTTGTGTAASEDNDNDKPKDDATASTAHDVTETQPEPEIIFKSSSVEVDGEVPSSFMEEDEDEHNLMIDEGNAEDEDEEGLPEITIAANLFSQEDEDDEEEQEVEIDDEVIIEEEEDQNDIEYEVIIEENDDDEEDPEDYSYAPAPRSPRPESIVEIEEFTSNNNGQNQEITTQIVPVEVTQANSQAEEQGKHVNKFNWIWHGLTKENDLLVRKVEESPGRFVCVICYFSSDDKSELEAHLKTHLTTSHYHKCKICNKKFVFKFLLLRHMTTHQDKDKEVGENVPLELDERTELRENQREGRLPPPPFTDAGWEDQKARIEKIIKETSIYDCIHCSGKFPSAAHLQIHQDMVHHIRNCKLCGAEEPSFPRMRRHLVRIHKITALVSLRDKLNATNLWAYVGAIKKREVDFFLKNINEFHTYSRPPDPVQLKIIDNIQKRLNKLEKEMSNGQEEKEEEDVSESETKTQVQEQEQQQQQESEENEEFLDEQIDEIVPIDPEIFVGQNVEVQSTTITKLRFKYNYPPSPPQHQQLPQRSTSTKRKHHYSHDDSPRDSNMEIEFPQEKIEPMDFLSTEILDDSGDEGQQNQNDYGNHKPLLLPHVCDYCGKGFSRILALKHHEKLHVTGRYSFNLKCHICLRKFTTPYNLKRHMSTCHSVEHNKSVAKCQICLKVFPNAGSLAVHSNCHAMERQYKCSYCDRAYNYASLLKRHMRIHSGDKPYVCSCCGLKFHELVSLKYHIKKIHTLERPHTCEACKKSFILKSDLKKHLVTHTRYLLTDNSQSPKKTKSSSSNDGVQNGDDVYLHVPKSEMENQQSEQGDNFDLSERSDVSTPTFVLQHLVGMDKSQVFNDV